MKGVLILKSLLPPLPILLVSLVALDLKLATLWHRPHGRFLQRKDISVNAAWLLSPPSTSAASPGGQGPSGRACERSQKFAKGDGNQQQSSICGNQLGNPTLCWKNTEVLHYYCSTKDYVRYTQCWATVLWPQGSFAMTSLARVWWMKGPIASHLLFYGCLCFHYLSFSWHEITGTHCEYTLVLLQHL